MTELDNGEFSVEELAARVRSIEAVLGVMGLNEEADYSEVFVSVVKDGRLPERKTDGAIGFDVYARGAVSFNEMDPEDASLRRTIADFDTLPEPEDLPEGVSVVEDPHNPEGYSLQLEPGAAVLIGVGFRTAMTYPMYFWLTPRSGLSMKRITLTNAPGTVDPDYRGEAGALIVNQSEEPFTIHKDDRIAQAVFVAALIPELRVVETEELPETIRGGGGFGSTGTRD